MDAQFHRDTGEAILGVRTQHQSCSTLLHHAFAHGLGVLPYCSRCPHTRAPRFVPTRATIDVALVGWETNLSERALQPLRAPKSLPYTKFK